MARSCVVLSLLAICLSVLVGCTGHGSVVMVPFIRSDFQPNEPLVQDVPITEAYYFVDEQGELIVALRHHQSSLLSKVLDLDWEMSIVLDGLPAGSQKLYRMNPQSVRLTQSYAVDHRRGQSWTGIAVIFAPKHGRLKGQFHTTMRFQQFGPLTGWSPPIRRAPLMVTAGEFEAIHHPDRAKQIRSRTEPEGLKRHPRPQRALSAATLPADAGK